MIPKVIKTAAEHEAALAHVETLMDADPGSAAEADLEVWSLLIEKYEEEHFPIPRPDPVSAIQFRMEQQGLTQKDLLRYIPSKSKVSEVLGRRRPLSLAMIRSLHAGLKIPAEILVQPSLHSRKSKGRSFSARPGLRKKAGRRLASR
jgi:HTH-type transcriptional regulator / antitoxin HigA